MRAQTLFLAGAVAGGVMAGCREATTSPRHAATTPRFATASDTGGGGGGGGNQFHFVANGDGGSLFWQGGDTLGGGGFTFGFLNVGRGGSTSDPQAFLSYFIQQCDVFFNCTSVQGFGSIPSKDLSGGLSARHLHLATNTTGNPNFFSDGPTGLIVVDWKANGLFTQSSSGTTRLTAFGFREQLQGSSDFASANATGSVVGITITPFNFASITTNHTVIIDIVH
ncbi:MAG TPA: hypothetical protein VKB45_12215 [Gemmatimonadales bacterium]|nr:hypothetical protein [Gemmatimonadales bacterium]